MERLQICEVVSDVEHLNEEKIIDAINKHKVIKEYGYILHDKDVNEDGTKKKSTLSRYASIK